MAETKREAPPEWAMKAAQLIRDKGWLRCGDDKEVGDLIWQAARAESVVPAPPMSAKQFYLIYEDDPRWNSAGEWGADEVFALAEAYAASELSRLQAECDHGQEEFRKQPMSVEPQAQFSEWLKQHLNEDDPEEIWNAGWQAAATGLSGETPALPMSVEQFWREWANRQYFTVAVTDETKQITKSFAEAYAVSELSRLQAECDGLRTALLHAQGTVGFFASVIKSGERWSVTCQESLEQMQNDGRALAALPVKKGTNG